MEVVRARRSVGLPVLLPLVLVAVGVAIVRADLVFGVVWLAAFGAFLVVALAQALLPPSVALTPDALVLRTTLRTRSYDWVDCADFHVWEEGRRSRLAFAYSGHEAGALSDRDGRRAQADRALPVLAGVSGEDLLVRVEAYRRSR